MMDLFGNEYEVAEALVEAGWSEAYVESFLGLVMVTTGVDAPGGGVFVIGLRTEDDGDVAPCQAHVFDGEMVDESPIDVDLGPAYPDEGVTVDNAADVVDAMALRLARAVKA